MLRASKKWGHIAALAEKLGIAPASLSLWKANGVPDGDLCRVIRETGANFQYLDEGVDELFGVVRPGEFNEELI